MKRITKKTDTKERTTIGMPKAIKAYWKLKELEDIEDELGIDLTTLFKAFNHIYYKKDNEIKMACHIALVDWAIYVLEENIKIGEGISLNLKDYGKTWALTKEELTNEK